MSNCYLFALRRWWTRGGYVVVRKSRYGWWPHALWSADLIDFYDYVPNAPRKRAFPPLLFRGTVRVKRASRWT